MTLVSVGHCRLDSQIHVHNDRKEKIPAVPSRRRRAESRFVSLAEAEKARSIKAPGAGIRSHMPVGTLGGVRTKDVLAPFGGFLHYKIRNIFI